MSKETDRLRRMPECFECGRLTDLVCSEGVWYHRCPKCGKECRLAADDTVTGKAIRELDRLDALLRGAE